jgi:voltage-gated potassium channel
LKIGRSERFKQSIYHFNSARTPKSQELQISTFYTVLLLLISSTFMYLAESSIQPDLLGSIPRCLWWSITTVSAVGYGDSIPVTAFGKVIASITSLMGIAAIAIPTGILASGFSESICVQDKKNNSSTEIQLPSNTD